MRQQDKSRYKVGGKIAAQLTPVTGLNETAKHFGVSKNAILQAERIALWKVASRLRSLLGNSAERFERL
jgi:hypothetical protein